MLVWFSYCCKIVVNYNNTGLIVMPEHPLSVPSGGIINDEVPMVKIRDLLSDAEFRQVTAKSDATGASMVLFDWGIIFATFWFVANWTNPITILAAISVLGGS